MADYERSGNLRGVRSIWGGHSKSLGLDRPWKSPLIWKLAISIPLLFFSAVLGLWVADRDPPTAVISVTPLSDTVQPGGQLRILYNVRRFRSCAVHIDRLLFDAGGERYVLEDEEFAGAPGPLGDATYTVGVNIPRRFAEGPGRYQAITEYVCNPLHHISPIVATGAPTTFTVKGPAVSSDVPPLEIIPQR